MYKQYKDDLYDKYDDILSSKCKYCKSKLYVKIFKNKVNKMQIGLYCTKCNKWHKFINEDDVFYYVGCKCKIVNAYGNLYKTKLYQLKNIINLNNKYLYKFNKVDKIKN